MYPTFLPSSSSGSSTFTLCLSTGGAVEEEGGRADGLGVESEGGGLMTLAFIPIVEGDSWYYISDIQYFKIREFKMYNTTKNMLYKWV